MTTSEATSTILPRPQDGENIPLSFAQEQFWLLDQIAPESPVYNIPMAFRIVGALNVAALEQSLNAIIRRHEVLRSTCIVVDGKPAQRILPEWVLPLPVIDLSHLSCEERHQTIAKHKDKTAHQPFDLATGPLIQATLLLIEHTSEHQEYVFLVNLHHFVTDGWSMGLFYEELTSLYAGFATSQTHSCQVQLPKLPIQYSDFAHWQRQRMRGPIFDKQLRFWQEQLADVAPLSLPTDRPRPAVQSYRGANYRFGIRPALSEALQKLSQREGVTLFMTLLATFQTLLYRYAQQDDILVATAVSNRLQSETERLLGSFANNLPLRVKVDSNATFRDLLSQVRTVAVAAYAHQEIPFAKLVQELLSEQEQQDLSRNPLFQVMFTLHERPDERTLQLANLTVDPQPIPMRASKFDLSLTMVNRTATQASEPYHALMAGFEYNTDLFDESTIKRMADHYRVLLEQVVANPEQRLSEIPLLTEAERHQLLVEWNNTQTDYPQDICIHQLFEAQVEQTPNAIAIIFEDQQLTYQELNHRANRLACYLQMLGVEPDSLVGVCLNRSIEMIVSILGILKAGGSYVALDPKYPVERLAYILSDTTISVVLSQQSLSRVSDMLSHQVARWVYLETIADDLPQHEGLSVPSPVTAQNLAYVIYTSGSTGRPKGVLIQHQGVYNLALAQRTAFQVQAESRVLQFASPNFDASVSELVMTLGFGATLVLATAHDLMPGYELQHTLNAYQVSHVTLAPSALSHLNPDDLPHLTTVIVAGEACSPQIAAKWSVERQFFNAYGPTEATVCATIAQIHGATSPLPIGYPIANTQVYILDAQRQLVPIGVPGEVFVGGDGLARGYLNRPKLTAERFIRNPFSEDRTARLYKTGDLARYLPDGQLVFLGRIDHQVKLRGFRIELGEIESILGTHPDVKETIVLMDGESGEQRLIAYATCHGVSLGSHELYSFLKERLPDYMMPSVFVIMDTFPLTPNGKVDRRALPAPDTSRRTLATEFVAPRTSIEKQLTQIWGDLLKLEQVGIYDNFFELGGHSLLAIQLISQIRSTFAVELPLRTLFEAPTVAELATEIDQQESQISQQTIPIIDRNEHLPLSFTQQRLWILDQLEPGSVAYSMPQAMRLTGDLNISALEQGLTEILRRHEVLRTTFKACDNQPVQVINPADPVQLPVVDLQTIPLADRETAAKQWLSEDAQQPFDLSQGPLIRFCLLQLAETDYVLNMNVHHIIFDGWSFGLFFKELSSIYLDLCQGNTVSLAELPVQYADFANWQQHWSQSESFQSQLEYWKQQLSGAPHVLELPTDYPRPTVQTHRGAVVAQTLPQALKDQLNQVSRHENVTLFMTLLAGFKLLCYRVTNQERISIGSPIAGREVADVEDLMGFFVSNLILHTDLSGNPTCRELLQRVRQVALDGYVHQAVPFEALLEELRPERDLSRTPLFQVWFNMLNLNEQSLELPHLAVSAFSSDRAITAKFDLTLYIKETTTGITIRWVYNPDLFTEHTIEHLSRCFQTVLEQLVTQPDQGIDTLPLLNTTTGLQRPNVFANRELSVPFVEFSNPEIDQSIISRFETQVSQHADDIAIKTSRFTWTYQALDQYANQIAQTLIKEPGRERVALLFEHDAPMVAAILGTLKAGKAYVPLDPQYPLERLTYVLGDSQATVILTNQTNLELAQRLSHEETNQEANQEANQEVNKEISVLNIDQLPADTSTTSPQLSIAAETMAYILYTSGSTGRPKGVMQNHRNVLHFVRNQTNQLHVHAGDRLTLLASYSFDAAVVDIFSALLNGATLYPLNVKTHGIMTLPQWLAEHQITIYHSTPTLYRSWLELSFDDVETTQAALSSLRAVVLGGEESTPEDVERYQQFFGEDCIFMNLYGSTESTISLQNLITQAYTQQRFVSVGYPIDDTDILLLNEAGQEAQVYGEIAVRSAHLALGYWQQPDLTEAVFLPDPDGSNRRIYRTGDLGRLRADGSIEFLGRNDFQIKLRGFRIEPREIEIKLSQHPHIHKAVVVSRDHRSNGQQLVAYVIPNSEQIPAVSDLYQFLKQRVPDYMVPSAFVWLDAFPLTPNGKVDRRALPAPNTHQQMGERQVVAPQTPIEKQLCQLWGELLHLDQVGIHDNFFELGGHSLLAIRLCAQIEKDFNQVLSLATLFQYPTVYELTQVFQTSVQASQGSLVELQPQGHRPPFFFVNSVGHARRVIPYLDSDQPFYGLSIFGTPFTGTEDQGQRLIQKIAACFIQDIKQVAPTGPYFLGAFCRDSKLAFEIAQQLNAQGEQIAFLAFIDPLWGIQRSQNNYHWQRYRKLGINYFLIKTKNRVRTHYKFLRRRIALVKARLFNQTPTSLKRLEDNNLLLRYNRATALYVPQEYSGKIVSILCREMASLEQPKLKRIAAGGLETHCIDGYHATLFEQPYVQRLAQTLMDSLREAQM